MPKCFIIIQTEQEAEKEKKNKKKTKKAPFTICPSEPGPAGDAKETAPAPTLNTPRGV